MYVGRPPPRRKPAHAWLRVRPTRLLGFMCFLYFFFLRSAFTKPMDGGRLAAALAGKRVLVIQADNRLRLWDQPPVKPAANFSASPLGPSILDVRAFAHERNYAYIFFPAPRRCVGPREERVSPLWCKVPALLYAVRVCRNHRMVAVMFVDTDVGASTGRFGVDDVLAQAPSAHMFVTPARNSSWTSWLARQRDKNGGNDVYPRGAINSGSLVVRCTAEGQALVASWWFELTAMRSPYELLKSASELQTLWTAEADVQRGAALAVAGFNATVAGPGVATAVTAGLDDEPVPHVIVEMRMNPANYTQTAPYRKFKRRACKDVMQSVAIAAGLIRQATNGTALIQGPLHVSCAPDMRNTLRQWPGDQDRLNWLYSKSPGLVALATMPMIADMGNSSHSVLAHWSISQRWRVALARDASRRARQRAHIASEAAWEEREGWAHVMRSVDVFIVDPRMSSMQALAALDVVGEAEEAFFVPARSLRRVSLGV